MELPKHKAAIDSYKELLQRSGDEILYFKVFYVYSFYNPIIKNKVKVSKNAKLTSDWLLISMEDAGFQIVE